MLTLNDGRSELWQWDTGRKLSVDAECSQVHFSNKVFGRSIDVDVVGGVATIPDILLQTDKDLIVWGFVGTPENGYTKISKFFKVNRRNKPSNYVFTPPEQTTLGEIMERLDRIEESQDPDAIKNAVDDYLASNPIQTEEKDPTVPNWAKQPIKPAYTASEVGALPSDTKIPETPEDIGAQPAMTIVRLSGSNGQYTSSHSRSEIIAAARNGSLPIVLAENNNAAYPFIVGQSDAAVFASVYAEKETGEGTGLTFYIHEDKSVTNAILKDNVQSVNGQTGVVELTAEDVNAQPKNLVVAIDFDTGNASHSASEIGDAVANGVNVSIDIGEMVLPFVSNALGFAEFALVASGTDSVFSAYAKVDDDKKADIEMMDYVPPVQSVNGKTGAVELTAEDVSAQPKNLVVTVDQSTGKASHSASEIKTAVDSGVDVVLYYNDVSMPLRGCNGESAAFVLMSGGTSAIATVLVTVNADKTAVFEVNLYTPPVQSVNGKTGEVNLTASDVGALPSDTVIPEAVTDDHINSLIDAKLGVIENGTY